MWQYNVIVSFHSCFHLNEKVRPFLRTVRSVRFTLPLHNLSRETMVSKPMWCVWLDVEVGFGDASSLLSFTHNKRCTAGLRDTVFQSCMQMSYKPWSSLASQTTSSPPVMCTWFSGRFVFAVLVVFAAQIYTKESVSACIKTAARGFMHNLPFYKAVNYALWCFIRNSQECHMTVAIWLKRVISVNHHVDSKLARYRQKGCFPKPIVRSKFSMQAFVLQNICGKL